MTQQQAVRHIVPEALPGFVRKRLAVPENHTALLVKDAPILCVHADRNYLAAAKAPLSVRE